MLPRVSVSLLVSVGILAMVSASAQDQTKLVKIRDSIYMAETASNVYVVTTPAGNVVIDTAPAQWAQDAKKVLTEQVHGPVKYIILTHGHADHIGGIDLWKEPGTQIIAPPQPGEVKTMTRVTILAVKSGETYEVTKYQRDGDLLMFQDAEGRKGGVGVNEVDWRRTSEMTAAARSSESPLPPRQSN